MMVTSLTLEPQERSPSSAEVMIRDWTNVVLLSSLTLALAVALHAVLRRYQHQQPRDDVKKIDSKQVVSVLQRDVDQERAAEAALQRYPVGCRVLTKAYGIATVLAFHSEAMSYEVLIKAADGSSKRILISNNDVEQTRVQDFYMYPIKSCRGVRLGSVQITAKGIKNDRTWMFADAQGNFITQRRFSRLALMTPKLLPDVENPTSILLTAEGIEDLNVPIIRENEAPDMPVRVWKDRLMAIDQGDAAANWINKFLEKDRGSKEFRLFRVKDSFKRQTDPKYAPHSETVFADGFPYLLALDSSLHELNKVLDEKVTINRFRPNIVLTGSPPFADESWNCIVIDDIQFRNVKPCARCSLPNVDPDSGVASPEREPQKTLTRIHNGEILGFTDGKKHDSYFGSNVVAEKTGRLEVGAPVKVLTLKTEVFA